ncbi:MAG TPA: tetratricopeptide repeat protein [Polaromonas sp.]|jgi:hypothetical protein|uniref:tetratricopeptide repeat protein n=1 Tax=Polaromonas sp. TaxID=1869339 RepID=UPI002C8110EF|nr:tetratricopeptide repeat protein [Polaromonas sp.]HQS33151.1 tetratricopeptide repeat protein [Polaromonas sp.]
MKKLFIFSLFFAFTLAWAASEKEAGYEAVLKKDYATAIKLLRPFAEAGDRMEQANLGMWYGAGLGVKQDYTEAAKWYQLAANQGDVLASYNLGIMYMHGNGVIQDYKKASALFTQGAEEGCTMCQAALGTNFSAGLGTPKDLLRAYMWLNIAAADTNEYRAAYQRDATHNRDIVAKQMSTEELAQAQELSRSCLASSLKDCGETKAATKQAVLVPTNAMQKDYGEAILGKENYSAEGRDTGVSFGIWPVYLILKSVIAASIFFIVTIGILKTPRISPFSQGRWFGAFGGSLAILSLRPYSGFPNPSEFFVAATLLFAMYFSLGFIAGFVWRKFKPVAESRPV